NRCRHVLASRYSKQARLCAGLGDRAAGDRRAGRVGHRTGADGEASPGESRPPYRRRHRNPRRVATRRSHRRGRADVASRRNEGPRSGKRARGSPAMNLGELSVRMNRVVFAAVLLVLAGGVIAYRSLGRLEDPEFTIKEALIITPYPGASA